MNRETFVFYFKSTFFFQKQIILVFISLKYPSWFRLLCKDDRESEVLEESKAPRRILCDISITIRTSSLFSLRQQLGFFLQIDSLISFSELA